MPHTKRDINANCIHGMDSSKLFKIAEPVELLECNKIIFLEVDRIDQNYQSRYVEK